MSKPNYQVPAGIGKIFRAKHTMARISPFKARPVIDLIRGKGVEDAITLMEFEPRRAASMVTEISSAALSGRGMRCSLDCMPRMIVSRFAKSWAIPLVSCAAIGLLCALAWHRYA